MPQLLIIAAIGLGAYAGLKFAKSVKSKIEPKTVKATSGKPPARNLGDLEQDQASGVYYPTSVKEALDLAKQSPRGGDRMFATPTPPAAKNLSPLQT